MPGEDHESRCTKEKVNKTELWPETQKALCASSDLESEFTTQRRGFLEADRDAVLQNKAKTILDGF